MSRRIRFAIWLGIGWGGVPGIALACSSCGCTLNSDWSSQGYTVAAGFHLDLRYDYYAQSELRSGTHRVDTAGLRYPRAEEIQQQTLNRNLLAAIDYSPSRYWGVNLQVPYFDRPHRTIAPGDTQVSESHSRGIGDARLLVRYQGFSPDAGSGIQVGLKLPTGRFDDRFLSGPQAGNPVDRGLQPGTGTTDLLFGGYRFGYLNDALGYFVNALAQWPVNARDGFRPGIGFNLSGGVRSQRSVLGMVPQVQLNLRIEGRERGVNADTPNSGATLAHVSPGVSFRVADRLDGYAFVQLPVYQRVNGLQLEPRALGSLGFRYRF